MDPSRLDKDPTFEDTYAKAEFSELIRLTLVLTDGGLRLWGRLKLLYGRTGRNQGDELVSARAEYDHSTT